MRNIKLLPVFIIVVLFAGIHAFAQNNKAKNGIAVLELFTSEGCSSCPPADALMGKLQNEYKDKEVYVLTYHVDYWDREGWKDVFSNPDYTKRQYSYARWLGVEPVYTPQLVINGRSEHIGSQESIVRTGMTKALAKSVSADVNLKAVQKKDKLAVSYTISGTKEGCVLQLAVVQKTAKTNVKRGENVGRTLSHYQIVRRFDSTIITTTGKGNTEISLPKGFNTKDFEIIGFVQDTNSGAILGADKAVL